MRTLQKLLTSKNLIFVYCYLRFLFIYYIYNNDKNNYFFYIGIIVEDYNNPEFMRKAVFLF